MAIHTSMSSLNGLCGENYAMTPKSLEIIVENGCTVEIFATSWTRESQKGFEKNLMSTSTRQM